MSLSDLPVEIICMIVECIPMQADVKAFMMSHRRVYNLPQLREWLYNRTQKHRLDHSLLWACEHDNEDLARAMLRMGGYIKCSNKSSTMTPLTFAITEHNTGIVKLLLEHDPTIINHTADYGNPALMEAVLKGHIEIVKTLLAQSDLNPSAVKQHPDPMMKMSYHRLKPLNEALARGNEEIVQILMDDGRFELDHDSLAAAADGGNESLVKLCIWKAPPRSQYPDELPLRLAALRGHGAAVKLLLEDGALDPNEQDSWHQTPLHGAALGGHDNIVKLLLDKYGVEPDVQDRSQETPLFYAAGGGHVDIIRLLLRSAKVDPDTPASMKQTPLSYAAERGQSEAVSLLIATGEVDPDSKDYKGRTPLSYAAEKGHSEAASLLLATGQVDPDSKDHEGRTPLYWAAHNGVPDTVRVLLETGRVNPNSKDNEDGRTPISEAAGSFSYLDNSNGCKPRDTTQEIRDICNLLRRRTDLVSPPNRRVRRRETHKWAIHRDPLDIIEQLLNCDKVNPDAPDKEGQTPLMWAARRRQVEAVRFLMATGKVNPELRDHDGWTARTHAEKGFKPRKLTQDELNERAWDAWEASL